MARRVNVDRRVNLLELAALQAINTSIALGDIPESRFDLGKSGDVRIRAVDAEGRIMKVAPRLDKVGDRLLNLAEQIKRGEKVDLGRRLKAQRRQLRRQRRFLLEGASSSDKILRPFADRLAEAEETIEKVLDQKLR